MIFPVITAQRPSLFFNMDGKAWSCLSWSRTWKHHSELCNPYQDLQAQPIYPSSELSPFSWRQTVILTSLYIHSFLDQTPIH
jgi:hypothetical protein